MPKNYKKKNRRLTPAEQKTTATFKLMSETINTLQLSLRSTQDELERYRGKYYRSDKNHAIEKSKNNTLIFHELLKFLVSTIGGGLGVNLISDGQAKNGCLVIVFTTFLYGIIVISDRIKK